MKESAQHLCLFCSGFGTSEEEEDDSGYPYDCESCGGTGYVNEDVENPEEQED